MGTARFYAYGSCLVIPGPIGSWVMRHAEAGGDLAQLLR